MRRKFKWCPAARTTLLNLQGFGSHIHRSVSPGAPNKPQQSWWDVHRPGGSSIILQPNTAAGSFTALLFTDRLPDNQPSLCRSALKMQFVRRLQDFGIGVTELKDFFFQFAKMRKGFATRCGAGGKRQTNSDEAIFKIRFSLRWLSFYFTIFVILRQKQDVWFVNLWFIEFYLVNLNSAGISNPLIQCIEQSSFLCTTKKHISAKTDKSFKSSSLGNNRVQKWKIKTLWPQRQPGEKPFYQWSNPKIINILF